MSRNDDDEGIAYDDARVMASTDLALGVVIDGKFYWVPRSVIHDDSEVYAANQSGKLVVMTWFAERELP